MDGPSPGSTALGFSSTDSDFRRSTDSFFVIRNRGVVSHPTRTEWREPMKRATPVGRRRRHSAPPWCTESASVIRELLDERRPSFSHRNPVWNRIHKAVAIGVTIHGADKNKATKRLHETMDMLMFRHVGDLIFLHGCLRFTDLAYVFRCLDDLETEFIGRAWTRTLIMVNPTDVLPGEYWRP